MSGRKEGRKEARKEGRKYRIKRVDRDKETGGRKKGKRKDSGMDYVMGKEKRGRKSVGKGI